MPVYEYKAVGKGCEYCQVKFEVIQSMAEEPIPNCPKCGAPLRRIFSRPYLSVVENLSEREQLAKYTPEEADRLGLTDGFAEDRIYDTGQGEG
jgi:putative FmdB family regulatory protein